jgi:hypothetical protein
MTQSSRREIEINEKIINNPVRGEKSVLWKFRQNARAIWMNLTNSSRLWRKFSINKSAWKKNVFVRIEKAISWRLKDHRAEFLDYFIFRSGLARFLLSTKNTLTIAKLVFVFFVEQNETSKFSHFFYRWINYHNKLVPKDHNLENVLLSFCAGIDVHTKTGRGKWFFFSAIAKIIKREDAQTPRSSTEEEKLHDSMDSCEVFSPRPIE